MVFTGQLALDPGDYRKQQVSQNYTQDKRQEEITEKPENGKNGNNSHAEEDNAPEPNKKTCHSPI
jgi:hypothetical protein